MMKSTLSLFLLVAAGGIQVIKGQNSPELWNEQYRICGLNYTDVLENCNTNPTCLTGDSCPVGYICYQLNAALCPRPTSAPSTAPSAAPSSVFATAYNVCAASFSEAANLCFNTTKTCATCNNATEACFTVLPNQCTTGGETDAPTTPQVQTEPPSVAPSVAPTFTAKPSLSPTMLTAAPTAHNRFFCATSWEVVDETCDTATPCPNGQWDCTIAGMTCYQIQADKCVGTSTSSPTVGAISTSAPSPSSGSSFASKAPSPSSGFGANSTSAPSPSSGFSFASKAPSPSSGFGANTTSGPSPSSESSFVTKAPSLSSGSSLESTAPSLGGRPSGADQTTGSSFARPNSSPNSFPTSPTYGPNGFVWTTFSPNGSSTLIKSVDSRTIFVAVGVLGAASAMF